MQFDCKNKNNQYKLAEAELVREYFCQVYTNDLSSLENEINMCTTFSFLKLFPILLVTK